MSDDEFDYAFDGEARSGENFQRQFKAEPMPARLVMKQSLKTPLECVLEEEEVGEAADVNGGSPRQPRRNQGRKGGAAPLIAESVTAITASAAATPAPALPRAPAPPPAPIPAAIGAPVRGGRIAVAAPAAPVAPRPAPPDAPPPPVLHSRGAPGKGAGAGYVALLASMGGAEARALRAGLVAVPPREAGVGENGEGGEEDELRLMSLRAFGTEDPGDAGGADDDNQAHHDAWQGRDTGDANAHAEWRGQEGVNGAAERDASAHPHAHAHAHTHGVVMPAPAPPPPSADLGGFGSVDMAVWSPVAAARGAAAAQSGGDGDGVVRGHTAQECGGLSGASEGDGSEAAGADEWGTLGAVVLDLGEEQEQETSEGTGEWPVRPGLRGTITKGGGAPPLPSHGQGRNREPSRDASYPGSTASAPSGAQSPPWSAAGHPAAPLHLARSALLSQQRRGSHNSPSASAAALGARVPPFDDAASPGRRPATSDDGARGPRGAAAAILRAFGGAPGPGMAPREGEGGVPVPGRRMRFDSGGPGLQAEGSGASLDSVGSAAKGRISGGGGLKGTGRRDRKQSVKFADDDAPSPAPSPGPPPAPFSLSRLGSDALEQRRAAAMAAGSPATSRGTSRPSSNQSSWRGSRLGSSPAVSQTSLAMGNAGDTDEGDGGRGAGRGGAGALGVWREREGEGVGKEGDGGREPPTPALGPMASPRMQMAAEEGFFPVAPGTPRSAPPRRLPRHKSDGTAMADLLESPDPHATPDDIHMHPVPRGRPDARGSGARTLSVPGKRMTARDRSVSSRKQGPGRAEGGGRDRDRDRDSATSRDGSEAAARRRYTGGYETGNPHRRKSTAVASRKSSGWHLPRDLPGDHPDMLDLPDDFGDGAEYPGDEWARANQDLRAKAAPRREGAFSPVTSAAAWQDLSSRDMSQLLTADVVFENSPGGCMGILVSVLTPRLSEPAMVEERRRLFGVARMKLDDEDPMHMRVLTTAWQLYMNVDRLPPRIGTHWEVLGFQRDDPATDLRAAGMLGLLHFLHLAELSLSRASEMLEFSRDSSFGFPLAVVSINATKWAMDVIRSGALNRLAIRHRSMERAAALFQAGAVYTFVDKWRRGRFTMAQSGFVMRDVESQAKRHPREMVARALDRDFQFEVVALS